MKNTLTFGAFKEKIRDRTENKVNENWCVKEETEIKITVQSKKSTHLYNHFEPVEIITNRFQKRTGSDCLAYRLRIEESKKIKTEYYNLVFNYHNEWLKLVVITMRNGMLKNENALLKKINEDFFEQHDPMKLPDELIALKQGFEQAVLDLPEFRLYAVTGMLEAWQ